MCLSLWQFSLSLTPSLFLSVLNNVMHVFQYKMHKIGVVESINFYCPFRLRTHTYFLLFSWKLKIDIYTNLYYNGKCWGFAAQQKPDIKIEKQQNRPKISESHNRIKLNIPNWRRRKKDEEKKLDDNNVWWII